jgi:hypothetical protein
MARLTKTCPGSCDVALPAWEPTPRASVCCVDVTRRECTVTKMCVFQYRVSALNGSAAVLVLLMPAMKGWAGTDK